MLHFGACEIPGKNLVANPGCYTSTSILALAPLVKQQLIESEGIVILPAVEGYNGGMILGVSEDGRTMVGFSGTIMTGRVPSIWRPEWGNVALGAKLEELAGCPAVLVSVGPRRDQTIQISNPFVE